MDGGVFSGIDFLESSVAIFYRVKYTFVLYFSIFILGVCLG